MQDCQSSPRPECVCFYVCVFFFFFWIGLVSFYLGVISTQHIYCQCSPAMLYSVENQVRITWCYSPPLTPPTYTETQYIHTCSFRPFSPNLSISLVFLPVTKLCSTAVFCVMCYHLMLFRISWCWFSSAVGGR